jgi:predicted aldo/keto reductase-like oxidoreductase
LIDYVYQSGVNYFDTAYMYHGGESERFVGRALKRYPRDSFFLASKMPFSELEKRDVAEIFEEQLSKCQVEYFDFYLLHNLTESTYDLFTDPAKNVIPYLLEQKRLGRIRHFGLSSHGSPAMLKKFLDTYDFPEFVQIQLNYLDWEMQDAKRQYEIITSHHIPVWVMEPCRGGRLASLSQGANAILTQAAPDRSIASWAFRYVASLPNVGVVLSGMTQLDQAQDNVATFSGDVEFTPAEKAALDAALTQFRTEINVPCTACHYCDGCPMGLDIPALLKLYNQSKVQMGFGIMTGLERLGQSPKDCVACGACVKKCPQNIQIPEVMSDFAAAIAQMTPPGPPKKD